MEVLDTFVESNTHIIVSVNLIELPILLYALLFVHLGRLLTVGLSDTAETITAGPGDVRLFQKTRGQTLDNL